MLVELKTISRHFLGHHLCVRGYIAAGSGDVTDEGIIQYIEQQGHEPPDDDLKIEGDDL